MEATGSNVPLLKQRKVNDVELGIPKASANPADEKPASTKTPHERKSTDQPSHEWSPETLACESNQFFWKLDASGGGWVIWLAEILVPAVAIWLYIRSLIVLSHFHPSKHWPEPVASMASACINASAKPNAMCENLFYLQFSTLLFCACNALNSLVWSGLWEFACKIRGVRIDYKYDLVHGFSGVALGFMCILGVMATIVGTLIIIGSGYGGLNCGEKGLPECVLGFHPVFFDVINFFVVGIASVGTFLILGAAIGMRI